MRTTSRFRALVDGGTQHIQTALGAMKRLSSERPRLVIGVGIGVAVAATAGIGWSLGWHEDAVELVEETVLARPTLSELKARAKKEPNNAELQRDLGHALFDARARSTGLRAYARALAVDPRSRDRAMVDNLLFCFGRREQEQAAGLLGKYKLTAAEEGLRDLSRDKRASVRGDAFRTLVDMGRAERADYIAFSLFELDAADCGVRRRAVERLGAHADRGDKRVIAALRAAARKDEDETPWYQRSCLGDAAEQAEKRILARR